MTAVSLTVNGRTVAAEVAPRTHLADFLREHMLLTGTHLGCEHGVCGACTVLIDDAPARSCIAFAAVCEGARIQTIEGLENDPIMVRLRAAFSVEHALQCGYCTPGMLVTARDIVLRLPDADAARIRLELAGNLCRCTGYAGIVHAIQRVLREMPKARPGTGSNGAPHPNPLPEGEGDYVGDANADTTPPPPFVWEGRGEGAAPPTPTDQSIVETIRFALPRDTVWAALLDSALIAQCVPGARLTSITDEKLTGELTTALGPIRAHFTGTAQVAYRPDYTGTVDASGQDTATKTHLLASAAFALSAPSPDTSELTLTVSYALRGPLAQFGRGPIVRAFAAEMAASTGQTLEARLLGATLSTPAQLHLLGLLLRTLRRWLRQRGLWREVSGR